MKLTNLLFALLAISLLNVSCGSDDNDNYFDKKLEGTTWRCKYTEDGEQKLHELKFPTTTEYYVNYLDPKTEEVQDQARGTYTLSVDSTKIYFTQTELVVGYIPFRTPEANLEGNKIIFEAIELYDKHLVYTLQR
jgi:hypothetical protein